MIPWIPVELELEGSQAQTFNVCQIESLEPYRFQDSDLCVVRTASCPRGVVVVASLQEVLEEIGDAVIEAENDWQKVVREAVYQGILESQGEILDES